MRGLTGRSLRAKLGREKGERKGMVTARAPASELCGHCALCCNGALFHGAGVAQGEAEVLQAKGFRTFEGARATLFEQPCHWLAQFRCSSYSDRPSVCRSFRCRLLVRYVEGAVTMAEARAIASTARTRAEALLASTPEFRAFAALERAVRSEARPVADRAEGKRRVDVLALGKFLDRHFRWPASRQPPIPNHGEAPR